VVRSSLRDGPGDPSCLGSHFVGFTLNTVLIILPLCFVYAIAFRALLNVFVIRIRIETH
jgi:heme/copper-type cytochrome/quinol oxidase subunit 4